MLIVYCEQCTLRIPAAELSDGSAVQMDENKYMCAGCVRTAGVAARPTRKSTSMHAIVTVPADEPPPESRTKTNLRPATARSTGRQVNPTETSTRHASVAAHAPVKSGPPVALIAGGGGGVLVLILLFAMSGSGDAAKDKEKEKEKDKKVALSMTPPVTNTPPMPVPTQRTQPPSNLRQNPGGGSGAAASDGNDARRRDRDDERSSAPAIDPRAESSQKRLAEAKEFWKREPDDPWTYGDMLDTLVKHYRGTPPAEEASGLLADLNLASLGPRPKDWQKDWKIANAKSASMVDVYGGKKCILKVASKDKNPVRMVRKFAITAEKPVLQVAVRGDEKGDFEFGLEIQGARLVTEVVNGTRWRFYAVNLAAAAGREGEVVLVAKPNGGSNEYGYFTQPRMIVAATDEAKVFEAQVQVASAEPVGGGTPTPPAPPPPPSQPATNAPPPPPPPPPPGGKKPDEKPGEAKKSDNPFEKEKEKEAPAKKDDPPALKPAKAAEPATPFGPAPQVDTPVLADYERLLTDAYTALIKSDLNTAKTLVSDARSNFKFLPLTQNLELDGEIIGYGEVLSKAVLDGLNTLITSRQTLKLRKRDGKEFALTKTTGVSAVKDGVIMLEQDMRGSKVTQQIELAQLTWQSRYELAKIALPPGPDTELKLAFAGILALFADGEPKVEPTPVTVLKHIDAARKGEGLGDKADHLRRRLERQERELGAETLVADIDKLVLADKKKEAIDAIQKFKTDFAGSRALKRFEPQLNDRLNLLQGK